MRWIVILALVVGCGDRHTNMKVAFAGAAASASGALLLQSFEGDDDVPVNLAIGSVLLLYGGGIVAALWGGAAFAQYLDEEAPTRPPPAPGTVVREERAAAWALTKEAAAAARRDDCEAVRAAEVSVRDLDAEFHAVVFLRDVAIARCLAVR